MLLLSQPRLLSWGRSHLESLMAASGQPGPQVARVEPDGDAEPAESWLTSPSPPATGSCAPFCLPSPPAPSCSTALALSLSLHPWHPTGIHQGHPPNLHRARVAASPPRHLRHPFGARGPPTTSPASKKGQTLPGKMRRGTPAFERCGEAAVTKQRACPLAGPPASQPPLHPHPG